jgi:ABC-type amino acid transport substrate-binding protein
MDNKLLKFIGIWMKQNRKINWTLFMVLILYNLPLAGQTTKIDTIKVAPFGFTGDKGEPTGMMFEISNIIAEEAGLKYTNTIVPYARTIPRLQGGKADFVLRYTNDLLPTVAVPLVSVISMYNIILSRAGVSIKSLESLHGKTIGMVRGGEFDINFHNDTSINKFEANDYEQMLKMLIKGLVDGVIGSNVGLYYSAKKVGITPKELSLPLYLNSKDFILHFSKKNSDIKTMNKLKDSVEKLKRTNEFKKIVSKYMGSFEWDVENQQLFEE